MKRCSPSILTGHTNLLIENIDMNIYLKRYTRGVVVLSSLVLGSFSSSLLAQGSVLQGWSGSASIGATNTTGNSESSNVNGSIRLSKTVNRWEHLVFGSVFKGTSSIVVEEEGVGGIPVRTIVEGDTSDRIALGYQPKFFYSPKTYFFGILDWEQDPPANIDTATRQIIGVGHRFFASDSGFLSAEVGIGNRTTELVTGGDVDGAIGYLGVNYLNRFTDTATFNADLRSDFGSDNTYVELGLGLAFKISQNFALKVAYFTRGNTDLGDLADGDNPLSSDNDSVTSINLVFDI